MSEPARNCQLSSYLDQVLGPHQLVADRSWGHGETTVVEVRDSHAVSWFIKQYRDRERYDAELTAYVRWVPALGDRAPTLRAHHDELAALVLSAVPGHPGLDVWAEPAAHRQAGVLLRRLHDAERLTPWTDFVPDKLRELQRWALRSDGLVARSDLDYARQQLSDLASLGAPARVPCHLDFSPRNWLIADGSLHVIDFEWAGPEVWVNDLARLYFGPWYERADLQEAFLDGYGRSIADADLAVLLACGVLNAVRLVVSAHERGDVPFEQSSREELTRLVATAR
jgi:Ser/Thr protein kinase RdoA (MazF antagonist)